jgi:carboxypeptidase PM20D1
MKVFQRVLLLLVAAILLLALAVAANTWRQGSRQLQVAPAPPLALDEGAVADKLAGALRTSRVSLGDGELNAAEFRKSRLPAVALPARAAEPAARGGRRAEPAYT